MYEVGKVSVSLESGTPTNSVALDIRNLSLSSMNKPRKPDNCPKINGFSWGYFTLLKWYIGVINNPHFNHFYPFLTIVGHQFVLASLSCSIHTTQVVHSRREIGKAKLTDEAFLGPRWTHLRCKSHQCWCRRNRWLIGDNPPANMVAIP